MNIMNTNLRKYGVSSAFSPYFLLNMFAVIYMGYMGIHF